MKKSERKLLSMVESKFTKSDSLQGINIDSIAALIVTYNPDAKLIACVTAISNQVSHILIIDNASSTNCKIILEEAEKLKNVSIIFNKENVGLATALNQGVSILRSRNYHWAITLDQDSTATPGMAHELLSTLNRYSQIEKVAFVGPYIKDEGSLGSEPKWLSSNKYFPFLFKRVECQGKDLDDVTIVITSGALTNLDMFQTLGPYRDDFFIDYIDTEYCLRAKKNGYKILVSSKAVMYHNLGNKQEIKFLFHTFRPTFHKPFRRYYIARNQVAMLKQYSFSCVHWLGFDIVASLYNLFRILLLEDHKKQNISMIFKGYLDGVRGKFGKL
ncbi:rhamnosyltransferase [Dulcicalothrix desertica PCC 7102]|uniref:Rhamnosyltransferase n=1 Tax=Dulcicalothrix desertica PCC 7102 TaxID=232991 RepID=A0A433UN32_9CYAN|nr:glycosyltransferase family 2 protein [Dulcicalothrix desertica]RUS95244.1 rhamnosyltransferase [Dulcicalothrix desertica PCC 7102]TWH40670.1 rhamnosyltransferase [Dulcicalothrix desertica PCC 7102]